MFTVEPQQPSVELTAASENSLNFTWNEYQHCNNDSVRVIFEFELRRNDDNAVVYSSKESNTMISFNDLEPAMEYQFQVRVSVTDNLTGRSRFSSWSNQTYGMTTLLAISTKAPPTTEFGTEHIVLNYPHITQASIYDNNKDYSTTVLTVMTFVLISYFLELYLQFVGSHTTE